MLVHGLDLPRQLPAPRVDVGESRGALLGDLGEASGALLGDLDDRTLESHPGRRHEPRDGGVEGGPPQLLLQHVQEGFDNQAKP